jgi:manganese efflux pump family protein
MRRMAVVLSSGLLTAVLAAGCSAGVPAPYRPTAETCFSFGLRAIQRHVTVTAEPPACVGLSPEQVNMAAARAVKEAVGPEPKAIARHLAVQDSAYLARMLHTIQPSKPAPSVASSTRPSGGLPLGLAALTAWFVTAAVGSYLLADWLATGGRRRRRPAASLVPITVFSHFGLAVTGLGLWIAFVITGTRALAWLGVGLIVLIAGLGMGALSAALSEPVRSARPAGPGPAALGQPQADPRPPKAAMPVVVIAVHGMLATATILLVLLAAIAAG